MSFNAYYFQKHITNLIYLGVVYMNPDWVSIPNQGRR